MDERRVTNVRVVRVGWDGRDERGWGLSPLGVFLVILGGLLLLEQLLPEIHVLGSALVVALGVAALARWATERRTWALYVGLLLLAVGLPPLLTDLNLISGPGWGTLFLGLAFLVVAVVRAAERGGWGWQLTVGAVLALLGGAEIAARQIPGMPSLGELLLPALLLVFGALLITRASRAPR